MSDRPASVRYDVAVTGSLIGCDYVMAEHLARLGLRAVALRRRAEAGAMQVPESYFHALPPENRIIVESPVEFIRLARRSRLVVSFTGSLVAQLRQYWPVRGLLGLPPVVNVTTGSDLAELAAERSRAGWFYRQYLRFADLNWCLPVPHGLMNLIRLKVPNVVFMNGFPYIVPARGDGWVYQPPRPGKPLRLFHCSHFDWNWTGFGASRNGTKGNDKFVRAFIRAGKEGLDVELTALNRGPDRSVAREMFERAGVAGRVTWKDNLTRDELYAEARKAHVVVNMFAHGGAGGISYECLGLGVPVMQYANPTYFNLMYGSMPPFINCRTENEILDKIKWCRRTGDLPAIAEAGREWVRRHIAPENALTGFLFYYSLLTGDLRFDPGPHIGDMRAHVEAVLAGRYDPLAELP